MSTEQIVALALAVAALISGGTYGGVRISKRRPVGDAMTDTTDVLLSRISELETDLAAERSKTAELEAQVRQLRSERKELSARVAHLEGQVKTLSDLVTKLVERSA